MCVICYIPKGVETPSKAFIKAMHEANPHGLGMCTPATSYKGLSVDTLQERLKARRESEPCLLHFRLATHGSIKRANCHPFRDTKTNTWFMHNGILNVRPWGDMTDSETAFRRFLAPALTHGLNSDELRYAVRQIIGTSRFAFMQDGQVRLFGDFTERNGCYFSNLRFLYYLRFR